MNRLSSRLDKLEQQGRTMWKTVRRVILRAGDPDPTAEPGELLIVRRIIGAKEAA